MLTIVKEKDPLKSNDSLDHNKEVLEMGQSSQSGGKQKEYFNIMKVIKISLALVLTLLDPKQLFKIDSLREYMLCRPLIFSSNVFNNASLAHVSYVEKYAID